jgi:hypothetical protein
MRILKVIRVIWDSIVFRLFLIITNLWLLMLHLWGLRPFGRTIDVQRAGPLADWFTGILTFGVVCVGALALRSEREKFHTQMMQREQERQEASEAATETKKLDERSESGQVYAWFQGRPDMFERLTAVELHLENRTSLPIYEWNVAMEGKGLELSSSTDGPIVPGHTCITRTSEEWLAVLQSITPRVQLTFHASNGEVLRRRADGRVEVLSNRLLGE